MRTGIISPVEQMLDIRALELTSYIENNATRLSLQLLRISEESYGLSGRTLRKIPFMAHAMFIRVPVINLEVFLEALTNTIKKQFEDRKMLSEDM